ncbi:MAG TPA: hypothetical protein VJB92_01360 [Candidatus Paceibacterota bacterium]
MKKEKDWLLEHAELAMGDVWECKKTKSPMDFFIVIRQIRGKSGAIAKEGKMISCPFCRRCGTQPRAGTFTTVIPEEDLVEIQGNYWFK